jgi:hypothetical protein
MTTPDSGEAFLIAAGVPKDKIEECLEWAFGRSYPKFLGTDIAQLPELWNKLHRNIFIIDKKDPIWKVLVSVGMAWIDYVKPIDDKSSYIKGGY